jgi:nucleotide-binding universal stress UspA family protein
MLAIKTILHPTDFSDRAEYGFTLACALARDYGARLILCHVHQPPTVVIGEFGAAPPEPPETADMLRERLMQLKPTDPDIPVEHRLLEGDAAHEIVRLAADEHCDLIVMGTHGRTGLARLLMGSVAELVVRRAPCPVLTIKTPMLATVIEESATPELALAK